MFEIGCQVGTDPDHRRKCDEEARYKDYEQTLRAERRARYVHGIPKLFPPLDDVPSGPIDDDDYVPLPRTKHADYAPTKPRSTYTDDYTPLSRSTYPEYERSSYRYGYSSSRSASMPIPRPVHQRQRPTVDELLEIPFHYPSDDIDFFHLDDF